MYSSYTLMLLSTLQLLIFLTLGKWLNDYKSWFPNAHNKTVNSWIVDYCEDLDETVHVKLLAWCLARNKFSGNGTYYLSRSPNLLISESLLLKSLIPSLIFPEYFKSTTFLWNSKIWKKTFIIWPQTSTYLRLQVVYLYRFMEHSGFTANLE